MTVTVVLGQQLGGGVARKVLLRPGPRESLAQSEYMDDVSPTSDFYKYFSRSYLEASVSQKQMKISY